MKIKGNINMDNISKKKFEQIVWKNRTLNHIKYLTIKKKENIDESAHFSFFFKPKIKEKIEVFTHTTEEIFHIQNQFFLFRKKNSI
jgi:hypothetical protein